MATNPFLSEEEEVEEALRLYAALPKAGEYEKEFFDLVASLSASDEAWGYTYRYQLGQKQPGGMEKGTPGEKARYTLLTLMGTYEPERKAAEKDGEAELKRDRKKLEAFLVYSEDKKHMVDLRKALELQLNLTEDALECFSSLGNLKKRNMIWFRRILSHVYHLLGTHGVKRPKFCAAGVMLYGGVDQMHVGLFVEDDLVAIYKNKNPAEIKRIENRIDDQIDTLSKEVEKHGVAKYFDVWDL